MSDSAPEPAPASTYDCPHCAEPFEIVPADSAQNVTCPHCGQDVTIPGTDAFHIVDDVGAEKRGISDEDELDAMRIRKLATARRAAVRSRSYALIAVIVCIVGAAKLITMALPEWQELGIGLRPVGFLLGAVVALIAAVHFWRRTVQFTREMKRPALAEPTTEPDFSSLSDGSQRWKNLENIE